jgi:hypothetical protein
MDVASTKSSICRRHDGSSECLLGILGPSKDDDFSSKRSICRRHDGSSECLLGILGPCKDGDSSSTKKSIVVCRRHGRSSECLLVGILGPSEDGDFPRMEPLRLGSLGRSLFRRKGFFYSVKVPWYTHSATRQEEHRPLTLFHHFQTQGCRFIPCPQHHSIGNKLKDGCPLFTQVRRPMLLQATFESP